MQRDIRYGFDTRATNVNPFSRLRESFPLFTGWSHRLRRRRLPTFHKKLLLFERHRWWLAVHNGVRISHQMLTTSHVSVAGLRRLKKHLLLADCAWQRIKLLLQAGQEKHGDQYLNSYRNDVFVLKGELLHLDMVRKGKYLLLAAQIERDVRENLFAETDAVESTIPIVLQPSFAAEVVNSYVVLANFHLVSSFMNAAEELQAFVDE